VQPHPGLNGQGDIEIHHGQVDGQFLATIGRKRAIEYSFADLQVVSNFFLQSSDKLSTPVVYDFDRSEYVCVLNKTSLLIWDGKESYLNKVKITHRLPLHAINLIFIDQKLAIVYENGYLQLLDAVQRSVRDFESKSYKSTTAPILNTTVFSHRDNLYCCHITCEGVDLLQLLLDSQDSYHHNHIRFISLPKADCISIISGKLIYGRDGQVYKRNLFPDLQDDEDRPVYFDDDDLLPTKLTALDESRLVVQCTRRSISEGVVMLVIDLDHGATLHSLKVKTILSPQVGLWDKNHIFFRQGSSIVSWTLPDCGNQLADVLGTAHHATRNFAQTGQSIDLPWMAFEANQSKVTPWLEVLKSSDAQVMVDNLLLSELPSTVRLSLMERLLKHDQAEILLPTLFKMPVSKDQLLSIVAPMSFPSTLQVVDFIVRLLSEASPNNQTYDALLVWLETLLETHYANFVVSKDPTTIAVLEGALQLVVAFDSSINLMASIMAQTRLMKKKLTMENVRQKSLHYSVEILQL